MFKLKCVNCGKEYSKGEVEYLCPLCEATNVEGQPTKGVLKVVYDYDKIDKDFEKLKNKDFLDLLPIESSDSFPNLRVGKTPMYKYNRLPKYGELNFNLFIKDEGVNPTFSFKDRASYVVSAYAKENGKDVIVAASTGNAGSSLAGICASQGQKAVIMVPAAAPIAKLTQVMMYGAKLVPVDGIYDDAFALSIAASKKFGWYNRNTAYNPHTVEGKKTVSFEIYDQIRDVDMVFVSAGDGCIAGGVFKGFEDLLKVGIIEKMPKVVVVQSKKSANIHNNYKTEEFTCTSATTLADSISVDVPANYYMMKQFLSEYDSDCITVSDEKILEASVTLSQNTGIFSEPAAACAFAGMLKYSEEGNIPEGSNACVLLTGSGLKDLASVREIVKMPNAVAPSVESLDKITL